MKETLTEFGAALVILLVFLLGSFVTCVFSVLMMASLCYSVNWFF